MDERAAATIDIEGIGFRFGKDSAFLIGFCAGELLLGFTVVHGMATVHLGPFRIGLLWGLK